MHSGTDADPAITLEALADLQAGLLDDATAARVRQQARTDPAAARMMADLESVRRIVTQLGTDSRTAAEVPPATSARIGAALRDAPQQPRHAVNPPWTMARSIGLAVGLIASVVAVVVGALMLGHQPGRSDLSASPTASQITASHPPAFPISVAELRVALAQPASLGPLSDRSRQVSCLAGLGYSPTAEIRGGRTLELWGRPAVLLLIGGVSDHVSAVLVAPTCHAADTGLLAETAVPRP